MNSEERKRLAAAITALAEAFGKQASTAMLRGYEMGLDDLPIAAIETAAKQAIRCKRFMPVPSELREMAGELSPEDRAVLAWAVVLRAERSHGYYKTVSFDDPAVNATLRTMGGWMRFSERLEHEEEKWLRQEFERTYKSFCRSGVSGEMAGPLLGYFEQENQMSGHKDPTNRIAIACNLPPLPILGPPKEAPLQLTHEIGVLPGEAQFERSEG